MLVCPEQEGYRLLAVALRKQNRDSRPLSLGQISAQARSIVDPSRAYSVAPTSCELLSQEIIHLNRQFCLFQYTYVFPCCSHRLAISIRWSFEEIKMIHCRLIRYEVWSPENGSARAHDSAVQLDSDGHVRQFSEEPPSFVVSKAFGNSSDKCSWVISCGMKNVLQWDSAVPLLQHQQSPVAFTRTGRTR
jgi:hypothetical protein